MSGRASAFSVTDKAVGPLAQPGGRPAGRPPIGGWADGHASGQAGERLSGEAVDRSPAQTPAHPLGRPRVGGHGGGRPACRPGRRVGGLAGKRAGRPREGPAEGERAGSGTESQVSLLPGGDSDRPTDRAIEDVDVDTPGSWGKCRCQRRFAALGTQSATLARHRLLKMSTTTGTRIFGCPKRHCGATSAFYNVDVNRDSHPGMAKTLFWCNIGFSKCRRRRKCAFGCPERHGSATSAFQNVDVNRDSHFWMPRTLLWLDIGLSKCRGLHGLAPLDSFGRPERNSGATCAL